MIPFYSRVVAIDDVEDDLKAIAWGLGRAGFCSALFLFNDGELDSPPQRPLAGIRIVFSDIHLVGGGPNNPKTHASNIIRCLKKLVAPGPYVLIFWSQFPDDSAPIQAEIEARAAEAGLVAPIGYGAIDKKQVLGSMGAGAAGDEGDKLRDLILEKVRPYKTLAVVAEWEGRVNDAAARATDRIFDLVKDSAQKTQDWDALLAFLACEAVGKAHATTKLVAALDSALLPLLEDQLSLVSDNSAVAAEDLKPLADRVVAEGRVACPDAVAVARLNSSYLVEEIAPEAEVNMWDRGIVTKLSGEYLNSGPFVSAFGRESSSLIRHEFATRELKDDELRQVSLHVVELGPECDHVQSKATSHQYLLALLVPVALMEAFVEGGRKQLTRSTRRFRNESVLDTGAVFLRRENSGDFHLLISCRTYMALATRTAVAGRPQLRLRRALLDEVAHHYSSYSRRPGVLRF